ncbi:hypothetical protein E4T39_02975 [Aureobasidium subglaciale]|nr:hypothetical protein E4T39_02975 [Aureobasidium subglaciale]
MSGQQSLDTFSAALEDAYNKGTFACGGRIPIMSITTSITTDTSGHSSEVETQVFDQIIATKPVTIRYGPSGKGQTLRLPTDTNNDTAFTNLISSCEPAAFGRGGENVYDEQYRKATKLDVSDFCTDFCPYQTGIIDIVSQLLMPSVKHRVTTPCPAKQPTTMPGHIEPETRALHVSLVGHTYVDSMTLTEIITSSTLDDLASIMQLYKQMYGHDLEHVLQCRLSDHDLALLDILAEASAHDRAKYVSDEHNVETDSTTTGIRAELCKLNVYSGPSGRFKAHVDTPQSEPRIGSLVVCLPSDFDGGILSATHQNNTVEFDWSSSSSANQTPYIHWAASCSDCSHEVQEVTAGQRVTLTYNLYASRGSGLLAGEKHSMDAMRLPLYQPLVDLLKCRTFMTTGGRMAIGLAHAYPYTHGLLYRNMPRALKGADMMVYETLLRLGLGGEFIRVMDLTEELTKYRTEQSMYNRSTYDDSDSDTDAVPGADMFYRSGFEPMTVSDSRPLQTYDLLDGLPGWERLGDVQWIRHPRNLQMEVAYMATVWE